jgi:hypothetical protein
MGGVGRNKGVGLQPFDQHDILLSSVMREEAQFHRQRDQLGAGQGRFQPDQLKIVGQPLFHRVLQPAFKLAADRQRRRCEDDATKLIGCMFENFHEFCFLNKWVDCLNFFRHLFYRSCSSSRVQEILPCVPKSAPRLSQVR